MFMLASVVSCSDDDPAAECETNNTGDVIIQNNYNESANSNNSLNIFVNRTPLSSNTPSDLSIPPGDAGVITISAGVHTLGIYLNTGSCTEVRCLVSRDFLDERTVDLEQCEELNMEFGL